MVLVVKEFRQTFRDPAILRMIFIMPALQLLILPFAADYEVKNIDIAIVDYDRSAESARLANKLAHSGYFHLIGHAGPMQKPCSGWGDDKADMFVEIPLGFAKNWVKWMKHHWHWLSMLSMAPKAIWGSLCSFYFFSEYNDEIRQEWIQMPRDFSFSVNQGYQQQSIQPIGQLPAFYGSGHPCGIANHGWRLLSALNIVREKKLARSNRSMFRPFVNMSLLRVS